MKYIIIEYDIDREDTDFSILEKYYDRTVGKLWSRSVFDRVNKRKPRLNRRRKSHIDDCGPGHACTQIKGGVPLGTCTNVRCHIQNPSL
jgi:hypothetical protein